ncbi:acyl carrier protein [Ottowia testudinis]|uniref:Acyl carrier protein n=1 Tax=Ottowia testudinis TaxID=2816950 RepID=A0A975H4H6_9BURK|nr:acyl carrier protein [Ottowia testudinis]QTD43922.1 acyl carrier protein [Ottowia testudinis]
MIKIVAAVAIFSFVLWLIAGPLEKSEKKRKTDKIADLFKDRPRLAPQQFYDSYFANQGYSERVVLGVREVMAKILGTDLSFLKDSDDFSQNLAFFWDFDSMANVELVQALEEHFAIRIEDLEAENTKTVRQLIDLVQSKVGTAI